MLAAPMATSFFFGIPKKKIVDISASAKKISNSPRKNFRPVAKIHTRSFHKIADFSETLSRHFPHGGTGVPPYKLFSSFLSFPLQKWAFRCIFELQKWLKTPFLRSKCGFFKPKNAKTANKPKTTFLPCTDHSKHRAQFGTIANQKEHRQPNQNKHDQTISLI